MNFDISKVPFSRYGSYLCFSLMEGTKDRPAGLYLRTVQADARFQNEVFRIDLLFRGRPVKFAARATPSALRLQSKGGFAEFCFDGFDVVRLRGRRVSVRLSRRQQHAVALPAPNRAWRVIAGGSKMKFLLTPIAGRADMDAPWELVESWGRPHQFTDRVVATFGPQRPGGTFEAAIEHYECELPPRRYARSFDACAADAARDFRRWLAMTPSGPRRYAAARELAAYIQWSAVVGPRENYDRPVMLMSKNWMVRCWCWDAGFNSMALSVGNPQAAWDQFTLFFDHQHPTGALPDTVTNESVAWNYCKPPVHGWMLRWMMQRARFIDRRKLARIYGPLARWTEWWFTYRNDDAEGLCQYNHGNDSGWDNATPFDVGVPIKSPDLSAFLVVQMDVLADLARRLGRRRDARRWKARADSLLDAMLRRLWDGRKFLALRCGDDAISRSAMSLLTYMPIVLGERLPAHVRERLASAMDDSGGFLTRYGPATESPCSEHYHPQGYWRGPIWAPPTMIVVDGLWRAGRRDLASKIARRFCDMCARGGMAENFDALTGKGLCDPAYTWTAGVFLMLAHEYV